MVRRPAVTPHSDFISASIFCRQYVMPISWTWSVRSMGVQRVPRARCQGSWIARARVPATRCPRAVVEDVAEHRADRRHPELQVSVTGELESTFQHRDRVRKITESRRSLRMSLRQSRRARPIPKPATSARGASTMKELASSLSSAQFNMCPSLTAHRYVSEFATTSDRQSNPRRLSL